MTPLQALVLGLTQGLSEFLPISSSGHLILVPWLFGWNAILEDASVKKTFDVALHMGTLLAVTIYFAGDVARLVRAAVSSLRGRRIETDEQRLAWLVAVATVPAAVLGIGLEGFFETTASQPWVIAIALALFGAVMLAVDRRPEHGRGLSDLRVRDAVTVGLAQAAALVPGVSRSGATITAGRALRQSRETAARFSFLLSIPVIAGAGVAKGYDLLSEGVPALIGAREFAIGIAASGVSGFAAVVGLLRLLQRRSLVGFVVYRFFVGAVVLAVIAAGIRRATLPG